MHYISAMEVVYRSLKMNYQLLGNWIPHRNWLVAPRFLEDVAPDDLLPGAGYHDFPEDEVRRELTRTSAFDRLQIVAHDRARGNMPGKDLEAGARECGGIARV